MIIINFKNYKTGKGALNLARKIEKYLPLAIVAVSALDVEEISSKTKLKIFAQHVDSFEGKRETGFLLPETVKLVGGTGTLLNHSEHKLKENDVKKTLKRCGEVGLKVILCVSSVSQAKKFKKFNPFAMAYEDPVLVGSGKSITKFRQKDVSEFVKCLKNSKIIPLCGAGVSNVEDVRAARELGCKGVLIASAIANSSKPDKLLRELSKID